MDGLANSTKLNKDDYSKGNLFIDDFSNIIDYEDIIKKFSNWLYDKEYTPYNEVFDYGNTTGNAIYNFKFNNCNPLLCGEDYSNANGNGSLMRILPIAYFIYFLSLKYSFSQDEKMRMIHNLSSLTHRHKRSQMACGIYVLIAIELLDYVFIENKEDNKSLEELVNNGIKLAKEYYCNNDYFQHQLSHFERVFSLFRLYDILSGLNK